MITQSELKNKLHYDQDTGIFTRLNTGKKAGFLRSDYIIIGIGQKEYRAHRLAWLYVYGNMPNKFIDHINLNKSDNRISNLRECTKSENAMNVKLSVKNKSGYKGVSWSKEKCKWKVALKLNGIQKHFGYFKDLEFASLVAKEAIDKYHKEFANYQ
jgi:hypothetical protein